MTKLCSCESSLFNGEGLDRGVGFAGGYESDGAGRGGDEFQHLLFVTEGLGCRRLAGEYQSFPIVVELRGILAQHFLKKRFLYLSAFDDGEFDRLTVFPLDLVAEENRLSLGLALAARGYRLIGYDYLVFGRGRGREAGEESAECRAHQDSAQAMEALHDLFVFFLQLRVCCLGCFVWFLVLFF